MRVLLPRLLLAASCAMALLVAASTAGAYELDPQAKPRWPFDEITYYVGQVEGASDGGSNSRIVGATQAQRDAVSRGMRAWTRAGIGWQLKRVGSQSPAAADILFAINPRSKFTRCQGLAPRGFGFSQAFVGLRGKCGNGPLLSFIAAHELGHVLGLGDERRRCAVMNQRYIGTGRYVRPFHCPRPGPHSAHLVQKDDRSGARALYRRQFSASAGLCEPPDESPSSQ